MPGKDDQAAQATNEFADNAKNNPIVVSPKKTMTSIILQACAAVLLAAIGWGASWWITPHDVLNGKADPAPSVIAEKLSDLQQAYQEQRIAISNNDVVVAKLREQLAAEQSSSESNLTNLRHQVAMLQQAADAGVISAMRAENLHKELKRTREEMTSQYRPHRFLAKASLP